MAAAAGCWRRPCWSRGRLSISVSGHAGCRRWGRRQGSEKQAWPSWAEVAPRVRHEGHMPPLLPRLKVANRLLFCLSRAKWEWSEAIMRNLDASRTDAERPVQNADVLLTKIRDSLLDKSQKLQTSDFLLKLTGFRGHRT